MYLDRQVTFPSLPNQWTPVTPAKALTRKGMLAIQLDGVPLVLFRDRDGKACALIDRCPHRSVKLSKGKITEAGEIECPFHGWRYDGQGNCTFIAINPPNCAKSVQALTLPCQELGGLLWVYTQVGAIEVPPLHVPEPLTASGWFGSIIEREWGTHWSRATQTMLDVTHIPYVHRYTIGLGLGRAQGSAKNPRFKTKLTEGIEGHFRVDWQVQDEDDTTSSDAGWVEFLPPNGLSLPLPTPSIDQQSLIHIWCIPIDSTRSRIIVVSRRNFGRFNPVQSLLAILTPFILKEDQRFIETASPVPSLGSEVSVPSDASTIAFSRYYQKHFLSQREDRTVKHKVQALDRLMQEEEPQDEEMSPAGSLPSNSSIETLEPSIDSSLYPNHRDHS